MIFDKFENLTIDRTVKAMIGMSRAQFDALVPLFTKARQAIQEEKLQKGEIKRLPAGGSQRVFDSDEKRLFFTLFYLKTYPTFDVLGFLFDLSAGHAHDYLSQFFTILQQALKHAGDAPIRKFESVNDFKQAIDKYEEIFIDGSEVPCQRPQDPEEQKNRYSGKKKHHTIKSLIISNAKQQILFLSPLFGGCEHDFNMMKDQFNPSFPWFSSVKVFLDLGFLGADKIYPSSNIYLPHKKPRKSKKNPSPTLTETQKAENRDHSSKRVIVENAIGGMKHFHCLAHRIRNQSITLIDQFFSLSAGLWNFRISSRSMA